MIDFIKNNLFKALYLGKGYPKGVCGHTFRVDETLRRFNVDSEVVVYKIIEERLQEDDFFYRYWSQLWVAHSSRM